MGVELTNSSSEHLGRIRSGERISVEVRVKILRHGARPMVGILIRTRTGADVYGTNTQLEGVNFGHLDDGDEIIVKFHFHCWLTPQQYTLTVATQNQDGTSQDWIDDVLAFDVVGTRGAAGVADLRAEVEWRAL
jgi:lipopolysaccharide transport system ATP-binding protein